jgi:uncharacterized protein (UPF0248 family)
MENDLRELLNKMKWHAKYQFDNVQIWYVSRGCPGDTDSVRGADIIDLKPTVFQTEEKTIPYHRILRIEYAGTTVFER